MEMDYRGFLSGSVSNLPAMQETQVRSLGWEDPLEKEMERKNRHIFQNWTLNGPLAKLGPTSQHERER